VTRRQLLTLPGAGAILVPALRSTEPENHAFPLRQIEGSITPPELFFVRDHFPQPQLSLETWSLRIEGHVARPYTLTFSDLLEQPSKKVEAVLECSGNAPDGSAASNGAWEGAPISFLFEPAGIKSDAAFVLFEGADSGSLTKGNPPQPYSQIVPVEKCLDSTSLVAFKLNGLFLPKRNGFPARALFPGWYAMDSVKWLRRIVVLGPNDRPASFHRAGMDRLYNRVVKTERGPVVTRLSSIQVKSVIASPSPGVKLLAGVHVIWGFAWTGAGAIREVQFSLDGGGTWTQAKLEGSPAPLRWIRWRYNWTASRGDYVLMSRAIDERGNQQPLRRDRNRQDGYELNWCTPVRCTVI
jgi:DMSO/TMAO reductase YedYZ molybdopterin-dependent catalytic subunit